MKICNLIRSSCNQWIFQSMHQFTTMKSLHFNLGIKLNIFCINFIIIYGKLFLRIKFMQNPKKALDKFAIRYNAFKRKFENKNTTTNKVEIYAMSADVFPMVITLVYQVKSVRYFELWSNSEETQTNLFEQIKFSVTLNFIFLISSLRDGALIISSNLDYDWNLFTYLCLICNQISLIITIAYIAIYISVEFLFRLSKNVMFYAEPYLKSTINRPSQVDDFRMNSDTHFGNGCRNTSVNHPLAMVQWANL